MRLLTVCSRCIQTGRYCQKVKVPKSLFVLSSNSAATFNFLLTLIVYFAFMIFCKITFGLHLLLIIYPILCLIIFNIGMSYILSALFGFFRDMQYLYQIFTMLLMYMSAIFYEVKHFPRGAEIHIQCKPGISLYIIYASACYAGIRSEFNGAYYLSVVCAWYARHRIFHPQQDRAEVRILLLMRNINGN